MACTHTLNGNWSSMCSHASAAHSRNVLRKGTNSNRPKCSLFMDNEGLFKIQKTKKGLQMNGQGSISKFHSITFSFEASLKLSDDNPSIALASLQILTAFSSSSCSKNNMVGVTPSVKPSGSTSCHLIFGVVPKRCQLFLWPGRR